MHRKRPNDHYLALCVHSSPRRKLKGWERVEMRMVQTREKGREATDLSTGSYISLVLLGRGRTGHATEVEGVDSVKEGRRALIPSASWAENIIMTECTQEVAISSLCTF